MKSSFDHVSPVPSSRSIVQINVSLSFQPHSINVIQKTCQRGGRESACLNATACFTTVSRSPGRHSNSFGITLHFFINLKFTDLPSNPSNHHCKCCDLDEWLKWECSNTHHLSHLPAPSSDLWVSAMLDDRKLSARALFDDSSHRQTQLSVRVHTGQTLCYKLPFHVYVSVGTHMNHKFDIET